MSGNDDLDSVTVDLISCEAIQDIDPGAIKSPALRRLIEDIREQTDSDTSPPQAYNRVHNRHNRGR